MKSATIIGSIMFVLFFAGVSVAAEYDAAEEFMCGSQGSEIWSYAAHRVSDGENRELAYGRVPIDEISKYGADAFYLPDGGQEYRPYFLKLGERLYCSPSYEGAPYDATVVWVSPSGGKARVSGFADMVGRIGAGTDSGSVSLRLLAGGKEVWSGEAASGAKVEFEESVELTKGDKVELRVGNASGAGPKATEINLHVTLTE